VGVQGLPGIGLGALPDLKLAPAEARWVTVSVRVPPDAAQKAGAGAHPIHFDISLRGADAAGQATSAASLTEKSTFVVPR